MEIEDKIRIGSITLIVMFIITVLLCFIPSDTVVLHESVRHNTKGRTVTIQVVTRLRQL